jgi:copper homeostasis protein
MIKQADEKKLNNTGNRVLEIIAFDIESCLLAATSGADRIELCDNANAGGTTPSFGFIKAARQVLQIPLFPIIRPRGGDFLYNSAEFEIMKTDVDVCKKLGCDGIVLGILKKDGSVDTDRCKQLVERAYPLDVTFHRAFDRACEPFAAMEGIINIGCRRILTSGQRPTAMEGADLIAQLIHKAEERIIIMPGSGIRSPNILDIIKKTGATEIHSSATFKKESNMEFINISINEQTHSLSVNTDEIKKMADCLHAEFC